LPLQANQALELLHYLQANKFNEGIFLARLTRFNANKRDVCKLRKHDDIAETRGLIASGFANNKLALNRPYTHNYALGGFSGVPKYLRDYSTLLTGGLTGNIALTYLQMKPYH
jgi:hypothetical protein